LYVRELEASSQRSIQLTVKRYNVVLGGVPERPKGADCKSAGSAFVGSNPTPSTNLIFCEQIELPWYAHLRDNNTAGVVQW
jgi:hypothetical protein